MEPPFRREVEKTQGSDMPVLRFSTSSRSGWVDLSAVCLTGVLNL